jgi:hypothetical protein
MGPGPSSHRPSWARCSCWLPIAEHMMDLEWPEDTWNCGECWSAYPVPKLVEDSITADLDMGISSHQMAVLGFPALLDASHLLRVG